jgi:DNA-binding XRE family transcriptional regulator
LTVDKKKRAKLEAAGWRLGDFGDFLGLSPAERQLVELRLGLARSIRTLREKAGMSQKELAAKLGTTQPRVVKIERADADVSLDVLARGVLELGGRFPTVKPPRAKAGQRKSPISQG